jgi:Domain of unknown function (DUF1874)
MNYLVNKNQKLILLNTAILNNYGVYDFKEISLVEAKEIVKLTETLVSAIGHQSTAEILAVL